MSATDDFSAAAQALADAVAAAANDPAAAIRLLLPLAAWIPAPIPGSSGAWARAQGAQDALAANLRGAACAALAGAVTSYQPRSYQDAQALRVQVCGALDAEAVRCADAGRDATYLALRELRADVALDLMVRGAQLPSLVDVTTRQPTPSLAEAWTLYQDTTREPGLVASADPPRPLALPIDFPALDA